MPDRDYYEVLAVPRDADADRIRRAYRGLAKRYHPDVSTAPDAAARMSEINEAYAVLSDPERRAAYDAAGRTAGGGPSTSPPGWEHDFGFRDLDRDDADRFDDFFSDVFGRMAASPWGRRSSGPSRGDDHLAEVVLDLADAWRGATRTVTLRAPRVADGGRVDSIERTLEVKIPAGVRPGQRIRLSGQGGRGTGGAPAGDLLLEVRIAAHPRFRLEAKNLLAELPVAPWEAALGAVVPVTMPDGTVLKVRVPAGAQSGRRLSVRGRGLPGDEPGDLELIVQVMLPSADDPRAREIYEQMARRLADFDPRDPRWQAASIR